MEEEKNLDHDYPQFAEQMMRKMCAALGLPLNVFEDDYEPKPFSYDAAHAHWLQRN